MTKPKAIVLRAPGTNCDEETVFAFKLAGADVDRLHINRVIEQPEVLDSGDMLCIAGGFSYGDDLGAGRVFATQIKLNLAAALLRFHAQGKLILGICNGFQVLLQTGLLLGDGQGMSDGALAFNNSAKFEDRWVDLQVVSDRCVFLKGLQHLYLPVAHAEGKFVLRHDGQLNELRGNGQVALTYGSSPHDRAEHASARIRYPENPNGSIGNISGLCDKTGRILGLMPHPERFVHYTQHPRWTRQSLPEKGDGLAIFENAVAFCN